VSRPVLIAAAVVGAALAVPGTASAQTPAPTPTPGERYIIVTGAGIAPVDAPSRETNASIGAAVRAASLVALPRAIAAARERAAAVAQATGLTLGAIEAVDESRYGPFGLEFGRFGPGRWCGTVTRRRAGRRVTRRECQVPQQSTVIVAVTFAVA
jgi:hypothetical protein